MNFGLGERCLYLHCAREGRKLDIIRKNDRVCFEMDLLREIKQSADGLWLGRALRKRHRFRTCGPRGESR